MILIALIACGPQCVRAHTEQVFVPGHTETKTETTTGFSVNDGRMHTFFVNMPYWVPDHTEPRQFCDEYEKN